MKRMPPVAFDAALRPFAKDEDPGMREVSQIFRHTLPTMQVFDFGNADHIGEIDKKMAAELWHRKLLRLPFRNTMFTYKAGINRIYLLALDDVEVQSSTIGHGAKSATAMVVATQQDDLVRADAFTWFDVPDLDHVRAGAVKMSECDGESDETFQRFTLGAIARLMALCMLLNTKGVPRRYEDVPHRLNKKREAMGKIPLTAVTYVDLSRVSFGSAPSKGGEKSMHFRRGHMCHYDDGSVTWVRDTIVKADGDLKVRERYQVRGGGA